MKDPFRFILARLFGSDSSALVLDPSLQFRTDSIDPGGIARSLNAAFLISLAWENGEESKAALSYLQRMSRTEEWADIAGFYLKGLSRIEKEISLVSSRHPEFALRLNDLSRWLAENPDGLAGSNLAERVWSVFFPEGEGIADFKADKALALRSKRTVRITDLNPDPITEPSRQILFTSNALLTVPLERSAAHEPRLSGALEAMIRDVEGECQIYWYDHPVPLGIPPDKNEILYGMSGLDAACDYEKKRGTIPSQSNIPFLISVSVTHRGLHKLAKRYLEEEISHHGELRHIIPYAMTEADVQQLIREVLAPAAAHYLKCGSATKSLQCFGVDGEYGRHYSLLKGVAALWQVLIDPNIKGTFKIDLDQVFPQQELVEQTGASAFEHLRTPLWGARGLDADGQSVEMGMIAGTLVNQSDIEKSIFTPDVGYPRGDPAPDEYFFFSRLPQALSTEVEMMTRYGSGDLDGVTACIQRIHVTGGTTGITVDALRRHKPFTPSFVGRAEDQAYLFSVLLRPSPRLAYLHAAGLIMRHDKTSFAQEAIESAAVGKLVGDYVRILVFSAYARLLSQGIGPLKSRTDPFTGAFISRIPETVVLLRFAAKIASDAAEGGAAKVREFQEIGVQQIGKTLDFIQAGLEQQYWVERAGWDLFYDTLTAIEEALKLGDPFAQDLQQRARAIIHRCALQPV